MKRLKIGSHRGFKAGFLTTAVILLISSPLSVCAEAPYTSYTYDARSEDNINATAIPSADGYLPETVLYGDALGIGSFKGPKDMFFKDNLLYVLDSGKSRIVVLTADYKVSSVITPVDASGAPIAFQDAAGIFVDDDLNIFVCDTAGGRVYILDKNGKQFSQIDRPDSDIIPGDLQFKPEKVVKDSRGNVFVALEDCYKGAFHFDKNLNFVGFFGSEPVTFSLKMVQNKILKFILNKREQETLARQVPTNFVSLDIDADGFIYTCRATEDDNRETTGQIRKLNYYGNDVLPDKKFYGDRVRVYDNQQSYIYTKLTDVDVSDSSFINVIDKTRGRVFQYDQNGKLLFAFGGLGKQAGTFSSVESVESIGDNIAVLDSNYNSITIFAETQFAKDVHQAVLLHNQGKYLDAMPLWQNIAKQDKYYDLANIGLGKAYEELGQYNKALDSFYMANDKEDYSDALYAARSDKMRAIFPAFLAVLGALLIAGMIVSYVRRNKKTEEFAEIGKFRYPFYTMIHPIKGFDNLKNDKKGSVLYADILVLLFFIESIFSKLNTGFLFNQNQVENFNIVYTLFSTVGLFIFWVAANWAVSTLLDGEGKFREIWIFSAYSLMPYLLCNIVVILLSNFLVNDEQSFYKVAVFILYAWTALCLFAAINAVHQFTVSKTILIILFTFVIIFLIILLVAIVYSIFAQLIDFVSSIIGELKLR